MFMGCFGVVLVGVGTAVLLGGITLEELTQGGRRRHKVMIWLLENLGTYATGGILIVLGLVTLWLIWKPSTNTKARAKA